MNGFMAGSVATEVEKPSSHGPRFILPTILDSTDSFGPSLSCVPAQFKDIPYAPFSKSDRLGRVADWNAPEAFGPGAGGQGGYTDDRGKRGGRYGRYEREVYGASATSHFAYVHAEDESSFSVVDNRSAAAKRPSGMRALGGRGGARGGRGGGGAFGAQSNRGGPGRGGQGGASGRFGNAGGRGGFNGGFQRRRFGWKDYDKPDRRRDASVQIRPDWILLEEMEYSRLAKLNLQVGEPKDITSYGTLHVYDRTHDKVTTKTEQPLKIMDRLRYNPTASDDPVLQELSRELDATVFATDVVISTLMSCNRSVYPWDIIITKEGNKIFMDKRDGGPFDYVSVNENATEPPPDGDKESGINSAGALSLEATFVNQNFAFQMVKDSEKVELDHPNPFYSSEEKEPLASCGYRYRSFDLSTGEDDVLDIVVRTEVDSVTQLPSGENQYISIHALNEYDPRASSTMDWRAKLDSQRGAVVATEMKNNSSKLARWTIQSMLAGAEQMKIGYISRANAKDASRHVILGSQWFRPSDFARQMNLNLSNGWGIIRTVTDIIRKQDEGKFVLVKDPNKPVINLYSVPINTFQEEEDTVELEDEMVKARIS